MQEVSIARNNNAAMIFIAPMQPESIVRVNAPVHLWRRFVAADTWENAHCVVGVPLEEAVNVPGLRLRQTPRYFLSVRDYGMRAYEPRQGRNAATVV